ncbi:MAG: hypothetical protein JOZ31_21645 [Verrucomicrobia bacterium]|nr:hypothetical protein [Verrucomicrobiota bacterium]MBV8483132.1 hypothetical protein [Verrucomicrobiota bacterium]
MAGAQSAETTVKLKTGQTLDFRTYQQMHSEMRAIEKMLESGHWILRRGTVVWRDYSKIEADEFVTEEPHCGFCTFFLNTLNLPLTKPTYGCFQLASRLSYILPPDLETDAEFMARVLAKDSVPVLRRSKKFLTGSSQ